MIAFQFPGQGSQSVGMGAALADAYPEARAVFDEGDDALGFEISRLCWEGPIEQLTETENAQPALLVHSVAVTRVLVARGVTPDAAAGHSLGEFSAHVAAGSIAFADAMRLVHQRGKAMASAGRKEPGAMAAILGLDGEHVQALCDAARSNQVLKPANYNSPGQIVISGSVEAVRRAIELAPDHGAKRAIELNVSGAFHSPLMAAAADALEEALAEVDMRPAQIPVVANVDATPVTEPSEIRRYLLDQLTTPVRWVDCVIALRDLGARTFVEPGAGGVLTGLLRRIDRTLEGRAVGEPADVEAVVAAMAAA
jgi:[acyl-carrier-protein] S-malonyltransferase